MTSQAARRAAAVSGVLLLAAAVPAVAQQPAAGDGLGERVFTQGTTPPCAVCHTLAAAGASGRVGPNLDGLQLSEKKVRIAVTTGVGTMPAFGDTLTDQELAAVARFVAEASGAGE